MRKLLISVALATLALSALPQVTVDRTTRHTGNGTGGALDIFNGPMAPPAVDLVNKCIAAVAASAPYGDNQCKLWLKKPCPPAPAASQIGACAADEVGSFTQTRTVTIKGPPTCSTAGAWRPASAPTGACVKKPPTVTSWAPLADEGGSFTITGTRQVRIGVESFPAGSGAWSPTVSVTGSGTCSMSFLQVSDPKPGSRKACQVAGTADTVPPPTTPPPVPPPAASAVPHTSSKWVLIEEDETKWPKPVQSPSGGWSVDMLIPTTEIAPPSDIGAYRTGCQLTGWKNDDPIVYPGQPGKSHLHANFGNTKWDAFSTAASLATTGNSTCRGGTINRSAYWVPAMIDMRTKLPVVPKLESNFYYKTGYALPPSVITEVPLGLRMIAGDAKGNPSAPSSAAIYACVWNGGNSNWQSSIPTDCIGATNGTSWLIMGIDFPQCWDGLNLDSPDHKSHMTNPVNVKANNTGNCPASHPVALPQIAYQILYEVKVTGETKYWRLSSDDYDNTKPAGFSGHGDYFMAWKPDIVKAWTKNCDNAQKDCHSHLLGDGRAMVIP